MLGLLWLCGEGHELGEIIHDVFLNCINEGEDGIDGGILVFKRRDPVTGGVQCDLLVQGINGFDLDSLIFF